ncbi:MULTISPECIES: hypothetical protein [Alphaproteobacteria]|uniref:hypothetical protein n=1 Tax=Alphaproteobacteria TaxID=28211 RepID=UPI001EF03833|nr:MULTISPECIES: hypothetical protein [Alphaproteobacteria]
MIGVFLDDGPAFLFGAQATHTQLIGDRGVALVVGGVAGVERDLHADTSVGEAVARQTGRLLLDEIARCLSGELPDEIGEAGVGLVGASNARHGFIRGLRDQPKLRCCGLSLPCHSCADP